MDLHDGWLPRVFVPGQPVPTLARVAREQHATIIVIGHAPETRFGRVWRPSLADELPDVAALHALNALAVVCISATLALSVPRRIGSAAEGGGS